MTELENEIEEYDWGGDGSDLHEPVEAHVKAALVPTDAPYPPPLNQLLSLGDARQHDEMRTRIAEIGLTQAHVPDLVRMTRDRALNTAMSDRLDVWAPIHALHALESLDVREHVADLIPLFDIDSDWFGEGLPDVLRHAGSAAIEPLRSYLQDRTRWIYGRASASNALTAAAEQYPELREQVVQILADELEHAPDNYLEMNSFLISDLIDLDAAEALPAIRRTFEQNTVDESIMGDWSEVQIALGQAPDPHDPLVQHSRQRWDTRKAEMRAMLPPQWQTPVEVLPISTPHKPNKANKQKNKRKMSAASRKTNKKKRK
jgi:hypothetical protein